MAKVPSVVCPAFLLLKGKMGSGDLVSSWAAAMVVDRLDATCSWGIDLNREIN